MSSPAHTDYILVTADSMVVLEYRVRVYLQKAEGWKTAGGPVAAYHPLLESMEFYQALVKEEERHS